MTSTWPRGDEWLDEMVAADDHRRAAEDALLSAQRNPVLSAGESFLAAQVHALLAIEARLGELVEDRRRRVPETDDAHSP
jgi:hypothetical protein